MINSIWQEDFLTFPCHRLWDFYVSGILSLPSGKEHPYLHRHKKCPEEFDLKNKPGKFAQFITFLPFHYPFTLVLLPLHKSWYKNMEAATLSLHFLMKAHPVIWNLKFYVFPLQSFNPINELKMREGKFFLSLPSTQGNTV